MRLFSFCRLTLPVILLFCTLQQESAAQNPFIFETMVHEAPTSMFGSQAWFDLDGDGDLDIIQSGNDDNLSILENASTISINESIFSTESETGVITPWISYQSSQLPGDPLWLGDIVWADVDGDGDHDLVMTGTEDTAAPVSPTTQVLIRDGSVFSASAIDLPGVYAGSADAADVDADGDQDLLFSGLSATGDPVSILHLNTGGGSYTTVNDPIPGYANGSIEFGDYDVDGDQDILAMGRKIDGTLSVDVYANDGAGAFSLDHTVSTDLSFGSARWGDYNADGLPDILISGGRISPNILDGALQVHLQGNGFSTVQSELPGAAAGSAEWADFDNDGDLDVIVAGGKFLIGDTSIGRLYEQGANGLLRHVSNFSSPFPASVQVGDMDGDADIDLSIAGLGNRKRAALIQYRNTSRLVNHPPTIPVANSATVDGGVVTLSWSASEDVEVSSDALTYALRVGTAPGASDVMIAASTTDDGHRLYARHGNAGHNTRWTLDLPNGTYYWSVQAVDNSYTGSPFSTEGSFTITESGKGVATGTDNPADQFSTGLTTTYPNPFTQTTTVGYEMTSPGNVSIAVYNVLGQKVRTLLDGSVSSGPGEISWDGRGDNGARAGAGVYLLRFESGDVLRTSSVVLN